MIENIYNINKKYLCSWFRFNPNLNGFSYENNVLTTPMGEKIEIGYFLISDLLKNKYFNEHKYNLSAKEFIYIIKLHVTANNLLNDDLTNKNEYVKNLKIENNDNIKIISAQNDYIISTKRYYNVFSIYSDLLIDYHNKNVPLNVFFEELKKHNIELPKNISIKESKFLELLNKTTNFSQNEIEYMKSVSNFIYQLMLNQELLCSTAQDLLDIYIIKMNSLASNPTLSDNEKYIYELYKENLNKLEIVKVENEKKEALEKRSSSYGFSSIALIILTVLITGVSLSLIILFS